MLRWFVFIYLLLFFWAGNLIAQQNLPVKIESLKKESELIPGQIFNLTFFITNTTSKEIDYQAELNAPDQWKIINNKQSANLSAGEKKLLIYTVQAPSNFPVGRHSVDVVVTDAQTNETLNTHKSWLFIKEIEKISLLLVGSPEYVVAGERFTATYLLQNLGNTTKKIYIETYNCDVEGNAEIEVKSGESARFSVFNQTSEDLIEAKKLYFNVRATISGEAVESIYRTFTIFPSKENRKDLFFRYPITASANYLASNQSDKVESAWQLEIQGSGSLDPEGNHKLEFLARGPNNTNLSFLGLYDQYYISYANKNMEIFAGERAYSFTPLTEASRFGLGTENKVIFNNGWSVGFLYIKPRFYEEIENEIAGYTGLKIDDDNEFNIYYISKKLKDSDEPARLASITAELSPLDKLNLDIEFSRGYFRDIADNAFRGSVNSQFSIFNVAGNYFFTGKDYPGYYSNSTFYSGNVSANLTEKLSLGVYAKEDFRNAALDTFFVTAPYSKSFQSYLNYKVASRAYLKFYWRDYERKDRLTLVKFHYKTHSMNLRFRHKFRKIDYNLLGEYGTTTNLLEQNGENQQATYRGSVNFAYRFNAAHSVRVFGSWSNVNSFVTGEQRNITAGMSAMSKIGQNFRAHIYLQNAYNIDDYFRNRNLMQLNLDYTFLKNHNISLRSFYTLFRREVENPEFTFSMNYTYNLGIPLKQVIKAGDLKGRITYDDGEPAEGIVLTLRNKTTITGENGEFWFKTVQPGRHLLFVDRETFEIDEVTNIPSPIEVEVIADNEAMINFRITKGAKLTGKIKAKESEIAVLKDDAVDVKNIILELRNEIEMFRLTSSADGSFSFPIVRPGEWTFKIYSNSIPSGYEIKKTVYTFDLKPGEKLDSPVILESKKRKIIFKSTETTLAPMTPGKVEPTLKPGNPADEKLDAVEKQVFYTIQVGAFERRITNNSRYFIKEPYDFVKQINNLHKYFIGKFSTIEEAKKERKRLDVVYRNPFIVKFKDGELVTPWWKN